MTAIARSLSTSMRRRSTVAAGVTFCDHCSQVCTAGRRADARLERARSAALLLAPIR